MSKFRLRGKRRKNKTPREGSIPLRAMAPNLITSLAACGGITSITIVATNYAHTLAGTPATPRDWFKALLALLVACICDAMDGRVARLLKCSSKLGAELDSLADFVNFGVAPAMFMYFWCLCSQPQMTLFVRNLLLCTALFYAMCDAFRLARFNTMLEQETAPYWTHFFTGVPAPGGCWMVLTPAMVALALDLKWSPSPCLGIFMLLFVGSLMASRLPTISLKHLRIPKAWLPFVLAALLLLVALLVSNFWLTLGALGVGYILTIPLTGWIFLRVRDRYERNHGPGTLDGNRTIV